jgi:hypothetical protein
MVDEVKMFRASDGSLHASKGSAEARDKELDTYEVYNEVRTFIRNIRHLDSDFSSLQGENITIFPWNTNDYWNDDVRYSRENFIDNLSEFIVNNFEKLKEIIEP